MHIPKPLLKIKFIETTLQKLCGYELYIHIQSFREITIGRSPENTIIIPDPSVSRKHASIFQEGSNIVLKDLGSKNGTYIIENGIPYRISEITLMKNTLIRFGLYTLVSIEVEF